MPGQLFRRPVFAPSGSGTGQTAAPQLIFEKAEGLRLPGFFQLFPFNPVLAVHLAALARFPRAECSKMPVPEKQKLASGLKAGFQAKARALQK